MSGAVIPTRRSRRKPPAQVGNVVPLHAVRVKETTEDIVRDVQERSRIKNEEISRRLQDLVRDLDQRHREHARQCATLGERMDRPTLDNWIEIGQRMLAAGGGRRR